LTVGQTGSRGGTQTKKQKLLTITAMAMEQIQKLLK